MRFSLSIAIFSTFFVAQIWCAVLPNTNTLDDDPNSIYNYLSTESIGHLAERYSSDLEISWDVNKIFFKLWTRESGFSNPFEFNHETLVYDLLEHNFDPNRPTKVLAHGFTDSVSFAEPFAKAYIESWVHDVNVIGIDWGKLAYSRNGIIPNYFFAANNAIKVGEYAGQLLSKMLIQGLGAKPKSFHAIGHSLGAHVVGHFGRTIQSENEAKIFRVTALDPASPWFEQTRVEHRVSKTDAEFVDVIHTNSGLLVTGGLSFLENMGHIDFYPNGGRHQPGCTDICSPFQDFCVPGSSISGSLVDWLKGGCSHGRSHKYYVESIVSMVETDFPFLGRFCNDWENFEEGICLNTLNDAIPMGEHARPIRSSKDKSSSDGLLPGLFLKTNKEEPFSITH